MADFEIPEEPEYNRNIRRFETTDPAHADLFNAVVQTLIGNDEFLKKVTEQLQQEIEQQHGELTEYTNTKIGQLINGAPETLDTLKEVANAIQENETVVNALDEAIGTKLNKDGDASNTTVTFTSGDSKNPSGYTDVAIIESGEKQSSLWRKVSLFAKNLRYLWKLCGTSDISGVGDGTLTGAVSKLNTDLQYRDISSEISVQNNYTTWFTAFIENGMVCINGVTPKGITGAISFLKINKKYTPRVASYGFVSFPASGCDINKINCVSIDTDGNIGAWIGVATDYPVAFVIQYPLKRN